MKAHAIPAIIEDIKPLLGAETAIVPAVNGVPWWYFYQAGTNTPLDNTPLQAVDPAGGFIMKWRRTGDRLRCLSGMRDCRTWAGAPS